MTPAIEVSHLTKEYRLGAMTSLREGLRGLGARLRGRERTVNRPFKALDDVSFTVQPGEVVGVIGHNGAGKSTLLKMISRITTPTSGSVSVNGRIAPLIEVGAGFVGDFTGRENVYLNGAILGLKRKEIDRKFDEIVAFAEMEEFIDTPVKRYSSGMQVKLAFAVATSIESEILIVDEVLAVGDIAFQRKCFDRMEDLIKRQGRTVLIVSHNIRQVERICQRVIVMGRGRVLMDAAASVGCNFFFEESDRQIASEVERKLASRADPVHASGVVSLTGLSLLDDAGNAVDALNFGQPCMVRQRFHAKEPLSGVVFGLGVHTPDLLYVAIDDSVLSPLGPMDIPQGDFVIDYRIDRWNILPGTYAFRVGVALAANDHVLLYDENLAHFQVRAGGVSRSRLVGQGLVPLGGQWQPHVAVPTLVSHHESV